MTYAQVGARVFLPTHSRVRPYGTGGFGWGAVRPEIRFEVDGEDVTNALVDGDFLERSDLRSDRINKAIWNAGGGIDVWFPVLQDRFTGPDHIEGVLDLGYRFMGLLDTAEPIRVHRVYLSIGLSF